MKNRVILGCALCVLVGCVNDMFSCHADAHSASTSTSRSCGTKDSFKDMHACLGDPQKAYDFFERLSLQHDDIDHESVVCIFEMFQEKMSALLSRKDAWHKYKLAECFLFNYDESMNEEGATYVRKIDCSEKPEHKFVIKGDIHGDFEAVMHMLHFYNVRGKMTGFSINDPRLNFVFLGDYIDRGYSGINTLCALMVFACCNIDRVVLLRGNHETWALSQSVEIEYNFCREILRKYGENKGIDLYIKACSCFHFLPVAFFIQWDTQTEHPHTALCCHGGINREYDHRSFLAHPHVLFDSCKFDYHYLGMPRCPFFWNDFDVMPCLGTQEKHMARGSRWIESYTQEGVQKYCTEYGIDCIFRSHQHSPEMMRAIMQGGGVAKLWLTEHGSNLWPGVVVTFGITPRSYLGAYHKLSYDAHAVFTPYGAMPSCGFDLVQLKVKSKPIDEEHGKEDCAHQELFLDDMITSSFGDGSIRPLCPCSIM